MNRGRGMSIMEKTRDELTFRVRLALPLSLLATGLEGALAEGVGAGLPQLACLISVVLIGEISS